MATDLAKAYVQIIPSADGIKAQLTNILGKEMGGAGEESGKTLGNSLVSKLKSVIISAGIGKAIGQSLTEGAALQQSLGGIETLFKDSANKVIENARNAYKTAGMSANEYMENVTSFSASLLQGMAGDTNKAADVADMAMRDMSDNANKMGTSMDLIQNAYQGFAKQNYTMLDNLKLGYGGTKTEMERLLADAQKLTGVKYDINNLADVYEAVHVIQEEVGITGTTAQEASQTFSGSFAAMKAAAQDFLGNLALGENVMPSLTALGDTVYTFLVDNLVPMVGNIMTSLGEVIISTDWIEAARTLIQKLRDSIAEAAGITIGQDTCITDELMKSISEQLPSILEKGVELVTNIVNGILNTLPEVWNSSTEMVSQFLTCIMENLPSILDAGIEIILNLVNGIINSLPDVISSAVNVVTTLLSTVLENAPSLIQGGIELLGKLITGLMDTVPNLIGKIPGIVSDMKKKFTETDWAKVGKDIINAVINGITGLASSLTKKAGEIVNNVKKKFKTVDWKQVGKDILTGIANGIKNFASKIIDAAREAANNALKAAKKALGIKSPSRVFRDQVGKMIDEGLAAGIVQNLRPVTEAMKMLTDETVGTVKTDFIFPQELEKLYSGELKMDNVAAVDWSKLFEGIYFEIVNNFSVDGTPLKEKISDYTINKINSKQKSVNKMKGVFA